jgi:hypothetical protein
MKSQSGNVAKEISLGSVNVEDSQKCIVVSLVFNFKDSHGRSLTLRLECMTMHEYILKGVVHYFTTLLDGSSP